MKTPSSQVRAESPFATPPRVRLISDNEHLTEAVALAEALDDSGAEADVRLVDDAADSDHLHPDAFVVDCVQPPPVKAKRSVLVALTDRDDREERRRVKSAGFDLLVKRPVRADMLMRKIGECLRVRSGTVFA